MQNNADRLVGEGLDHHRAGRFDDAERCYHAALEQDPACADAWHLLALLAREISMLDVALELVSQAVSLSPDVALFRVTQGDILRDSQDLAGAEDAYKAALEVMPESFEAMSGLGLLYRAQQRPDDAKPYLIGALALRPQSPEALSNLGAVLEMQGHVPEAIECYRRAVALSPDAPGLLANLGGALAHAGDYVAAESYLLRCIELEPGNPDPVLLYCRTLRRAGDYDRALPRLERAINDFPGNSDLLLEKGILLIRMDDPDAAESILVQAGQVHPRPEVSVALASVAQLRGDMERAARLCRQAVGMDERYGPAWGLLGRIFILQQKIGDAEACLRKVVELAPDDAESLKLHATALGMLGRHGDSLVAYERALTMQPGLPGLAYEYGLCLHRVGRSQEAIAFLRKVMAGEQKREELFGAATNLAMIYKDLGDMRESLAAQRLAIAEPRFHSNLIFSMMYASDVQPEEILAEAKAYDAMHCRPLVPSEPRAFGNAPIPARKLRIGFVSGDLRDHAVAYFVEPVWQELDREQFEIHAYYTHFVTDHVTRRLKGLATRWHNVGTFSEEKLHAQILADGIDILVDLSGHTAANRLLVFARRAAPVQFGWLGHPATTGVSQMDYLLTNRYSEPEGMTEHLSTETLWRMPESYCVYRPGLNSPAVVEQAPCETRGYVTFGCFNNLAKVTEDVIRVWSRILVAVPDSRLMLEWTTFSDPAIADQFAARFAPYGVSRERLELVPRRKENQYRLYNEIDCALDPFPCNGGTTGFDTVWMGVPYVTLAGRHLMSRMGVMILSNVGLSHLIAQTEDEYVALAAHLATDRDYLMAQRANLRERMQGSPLMDAARFTRHFEAALRGMWQRWCAQQEGQA